MAYDIFVSYSTQDKLFVDALVHSLEERGYRCWYAPRDITAGVTWPAAITRAIREVPVMLLVFSASSNSSDEISKELTLASSNKCMVIPVRIENVPPGPELEYHLSNRHWLDVYDLETEKAIERVREGLERYAHLFPERTQGNEPEPSGPEGAQAQPQTAGQAIPQKALPRRAKIIAALVLLLLLAGGGLARYMQDRPEPDQYAQLLAPAQKSSLYRYSDREGQPVQAYLMRLAKLAEEEEDTYLVAITGFGGSLDGRIYRCVMRLDSTAMRFVATIKNAQRTLLSVDQQGRGQAYSPKDGREFKIAADRRDSEPEILQNYLRAYQDGKPWRPGAR